MPNSKPIRNTDPESELDPATGNSELEIVTPQSTLNSAPDRAHNPETAAGDQLTDLSSLIENLEEAGSHPRRAEQEQRQNDLVLVRMGIASSLFSALHAKHPPTAAHSLRVALGCSAWSRFVKLDVDRRDLLEVGSLLHDIGKIGITDQILWKPGKLSDDESMTVERHRHVGIRILERSCTAPEILDMVRYAPAWFNGRRCGFDRQGADLPLGARMIAIVDAFDSMTTDHVYRPAMSRERAIAKLYENAGTQFDPRLTEHFCDLLQANQLGVDECARQWLRDLRPEDSQHFWQLKQQIPSPPQEPDVDSLFHCKLLDSMHDAVIFVDPSMQILLWNRAAEVMTGISEVAVRRHSWTPALIELCSESNYPLDGCPLKTALATRSPEKRRLTIRGRKDRLTVDVDIIPVIGPDGIAHGATMLLHDASSRISLEETVQTLHVQATRDPLTQVANRAEFDRMLSVFVEEHLAQNIACSLIICDADRFKSINDNYGHQAGDQALIRFATMLKNNCRAGDLVARYGGEEFVMLCADCDNASATERAEIIRKELSVAQQPALAGGCMTASFGVTEIQPGDTSDTMLRRADRALLQAKDAGRNRVIQLGSGISGESAQPEVKPTWFSWFQAATPDNILEQTLSTSVPLNVAAEKLRGFVADHVAHISTVEENKITLKIEGTNTPFLRRGNDRPVPFVISLVFEEKKADATGRQEGECVRTLIHVTIRPRRNRDRRRDDAIQRARQLLASMKSYFIAHDYQLSAPSAQNLE